MKIHKIIEESRSQDIWRQELYNMSPYFPDFIIESKEEISGLVYYLSSKLRYKYKDVWYTRHHIETYLIKEGKEVTRDIQSKLTKMFLRSIYLDIKYGKPMIDIDRKDKLQIDELQRLGLKDA